MKTFRCIAASMAIGVVLLISACVSSAQQAQIDANLQAFAQQTNSYVTAFNQEMARVAQAGAAVTLKSAQYACGASSMLNGLYNNPLTQTIMAANRVDPSVTATERATFAVVSNDCSQIDRAVASGTTPATAVVAIDDVIKSVGMLKSALQTAAPAVAARVTTPSSS